MSANALTAPRHDSCDLPPPADPPWTDDGSAPPLTVAYVTGDEASARILLQAGGSPFCASQLRFTFPDASSLFELRVEGWIVDAASLHADVTALVRDIRGARPHAPVIALRARNRTEMVAWLRAGADYAVCEDRHGEELSARLCAFARRVRGFAWRDRVRVGDIVLDRGAQCVWRGGRRVRATAREFKMLECLVEHAGTTVSAMQLRDYMWVYRGNVRPSTNTVEVYIANLRRMLRGSANVSIQTVPRAGYVLCLHPPSAQ